MRIPPTKCRMFGVLLLGVLGAAPTTRPTRVYDAEVRKGAHLVVETQPIRPRPQAAAELKSQEVGHPIRAVRAAVWLEDKDEPRALLWTADFHSSRTLALPNTDLFTLFGVKLLANDALVLVYFDPTAIHADLVSQEVGGRSLISPTAKPTHWKEALVAGALAECVRSVDVEGDLSTGLTVTLRGRQNLMHRNFQQSFKLNKDGKAYVWKSVTDGPVFEKPDPPYPQQSLPAGSPTRIESDFKAASQPSPSSE